MSERIHFSCSSGSSPSFYFTFLPTRYVCTCSRECQSARSVLDSRPRRFEICRRAGALVRKLWRYSTGVQVECCSVVALAALAALAALRSAVARQLRQASVGDADSCGARGVGTARATAIALAISAAFVGQFLLSQHCCLPACTTRATTGGQPGANSACCCAAVVTPGQKQLCRSQSCLCSKAGLPNCEKGGSLRQPVSEYGV